LKMKNYMVSALVGFFLSVSLSPAHAATVTTYDGLLYAEMGPLTAALQKKGNNVVERWHDNPTARCPQYIIGHSMGGNRAIQQGLDCQAKGKPPVAIIVIDAGRCPGNSPCSVPASARFSCVSYYDPSHGIGGQYISGKCRNVRISGYTHLQMPSVPAVVRGVLATVK
jgi:hypothetical protein